MCGCSERNNPEYHFTSTALQDFSSFLGAFSVVNLSPGPGHCQSHWRFHSNWFTLPQQRKVLETSCALCLFSAFSADRKILMAKVYCPSPFLYIIDTLATLSASTIIVTCICLEMHHI